MKLYCWLLHKQTSKTLKTGATYLIQCALMKLKREKEASEIGYSQPRHFANGLNFQKNRPWEDENLSKNTS